MLTDSRKYSFHKSIFPDDALDFSKRSSLIKEKMLERIYPTKLIIPMKQNYGSECIPCVKPGDKVLIGTCVGIPPKNSLGAPVHCGISGTVTEIRDITLPDGTKTSAVCIENDGKRTRHPSIVHRNSFDIDAKQVLGIVNSAGVVGMGGEGIPTASKLLRAKKLKVNTLLVNCLQSEPFSTCDLYLVDERPDSIVMGAIALAKCCGASNIDFLISEKRKTERQALETACDRIAEEYPDIKFELRLFKERFPQGYYRLVARALYDVELSSHETLEEKCGAVLFNCSTLSACWDAISENMPLTSRIVTVSDDSVSGHNVIAPIGTPISEIMNSTEVPVETSGRIVLGNALTGIGVSSSENVPVTKTTSAITVIKSIDQPTIACIHCGQCADACPMGIFPSLASRMIELGYPSLAKNAGASKCISCGVCSYVCPAGINLTGIVASFAARVNRDKKEQKRTDYEGVELNDISLLEPYADVADENEASNDAETLILPFEGGKKV